MNICVLKNNAVIQNGNQTHKCGDILNFLNHDRSYLPWSTVCVWVFESERASKRERGSSKVQTYSLLVTKRSRRNLKLFSQWKLLWCANSILKEGKICMKNSFKKWISWTWDSISKSLWNIKLDRHLLYSSCSLLSWLKKEKSFFLFPKERGFHPVNFISPWFQKNLKKKGKQMCKRQFVVPWLFFV